MLVFAGRQMIHKNHGMTSTLIRGSNKITARRHLILRTYARTSRFLLILYDDCRAKYRRRRSRLCVANIQRAQCSLRLCATHLPYFMIEGRIMPLKYRRFLLYHLMTHAISTLKWPVGGEIRYYFAVRPFQQCCSWNMYNIINKSILKSVSSKMPIFIYYSLVHA